MQVPPGRFRNPIAFVLVAICLGTSQVRSDPVISAEVGSGTGVAVPEIGDVYWEQLPTGGVLSSQADACYPFTSETSDDFVGNGGVIHAVSWWGSYFQGSPLSPDAFALRIYADDAGRPGTLLEEFSTSDYHEVLETWYYAYCADDLAFDAFSGERYHLSIQAVVCFPPHWGRVGGAGNGVHGYFRSAFFGYPDWVDAIDVNGESEFSFLVGNYTCAAATPIDHRTWSAIKSHYRH